VAQGIGPLAAGPRGTLYVAVTDEFAITHVAVLSSEGDLTVLPYQIDGKITGPLLVVPDGTVYLVACDQVSSCSLYRNGGWEDGWPVSLMTASAARVEVTCAGPVAGPDGTILVACAEQGTAGPANGRVFAIEPTGQSKAGWPVAVTGDSILVGPDGTVYVGASAGSPGDRASRRLSITAINPDGEVRAGWPIRLPGDDPGFATGPSGTIYAWWRSGVNAQGECRYDADQTGYAAIGLDGRTRSGWPRRVAGAGSAPVVGADGTLYYVTPKGDAFAVDPAGRTKAGWPVRGVGLGWSCDSPTSSPYLGPDGTVFLLTDSIIALDPMGRPLPGWPYAPKGSLTEPGVTPGPWAPLAPVFGQDGTVYVTTWAFNGEGPVAQVEAIDRAGNREPGWPQPFGSENAPSLLASDDRLVVATDGPVDLPDWPWPLWVTCVQPVDPAGGLPYLGCDYQVTPTEPPKE